MKPSDEVLLIWAVVFGGGLLLFSIFVVGVGLWHGR
jgi:hypothetical protein